MPPELLVVVATVALTLAAILVVSGQCRKPRWGLGRLFLWKMNESHSLLTDWGLQQVPLGKNSTILDIGCGGGRTINKLAAIASDGKIHGIDYSATSVAMARSANACWIAAGRVEIQQASVSHLPFPDGSFDVVTAVETHYYWPNLESDLREILRVLKPGGRLAVIAESYKGRRFDIFYRPVMKLLRANYLSVEEHRKLLSAAGYSDVLVQVDRRKGWICAIGIRAKKAETSQIKPETA